MGRYGDRRFLRNSQNVFPSEDDGSPVPETNINDVSFQDNNDIVDEFGMAVPNTPMFKHENGAEFLLDERLGTVSPNEYNQDNQPIYIKPGHTCLLQHINSAPSNMAEILKSTEGTGLAKEYSNQAAERIQSTNQANIDKNIDNRQAYCPKFKDAIRLQMEDIGRRNDATNQNGDQPCVSEKMGPSQFEPQFTEWNKHVTNEENGPPSKNEDRKKSADPHIHHLHHHEFVHTKTHYRDFNPSHKIFRPPPNHYQAPAVNVHVIQNQHTSVNPNHATHPVGGFSNEGYYNHGQPQHGTSINQAQFVDTHSSTGWPGSQTSVHQNQFAHTGVLGNPMEDTGMLQEHLVNVPVAGYGDTMRTPLGNKQEEANDQNVGTFQMLNPHIDSSEHHQNYDRGEYLQSYDPDEPQNRQAIVRYIENEQKSINNMLHFLKGRNSQQDLQEFNYHGTSRDGHPEQHFQRQPAERTPENVAAMNDFNNELHLPGMGNIPTDLPLTHNTERPDIEHQQKAIAKYLEIEQKNMEMAIQEVQEEHQENLDGLMEYLNGNPINENVHDRTHFQDDNNQGDENIGRLGNAYQNNFYQRAASTRAEQERENTEMLTRLIENDPDVQEKLGMDSQNNPLLRYIFQVPERRFSDEYYQRPSRSLNRTSIDFDKLLGKEKEMINSIKRDAKHDEDMMMISYIGSSLINDMEDRLNKTKRTKREIGGHNLPLSRLITDPRAKFDMPKTLENIGAVARTTFEHEKAPMYHVRNMAGSAKNAVLAAMKIPTQNFIIPSDYDIIKNHQSKENVGAINPRIFSRNGSPVDTNQDDQWPTNTVTSTFRKVGLVIRDSVKSGQEALAHVGDVANHAKNAIHSTKYAAPRIILKSIPAVTKVPRKKAMIITPRIFDVSEGNDQVGKALDNPDQEYVKMGHILDAIGVSKPNPVINFEKITIEPRSPFSDFPQAKFAKLQKRPNNFNDFFQTIKVEDVKNGGDNELVGKTLNNLEDAKISIGAKNLQDFILRMKNELQEILRNEIEGRKLKMKNLRRNSPQQNVKLPDAKSDTPRNSPGSQFPTKLQKKQNSGETVGLLLPPQLMHPFMDQPSPSQMHEFLEENNDEPKTQNNRNYDSKLGAPQYPPNLQSPSKFRMNQNHNKTVGSDLLMHPIVGQVSPSQMHESLEENSDEPKTQYQNDRDLAQVLGAINPMMFERIFNESLKIKLNPNRKSPHDVFHHNHNGHSHGPHNVQVDPNERLSTGIGIKGQILKPFMGQATSKNKEDFFNKYSSNSKKIENDKSEIPADYVEVEDFIGPQWDRKDEDDSLDYD